MTGSRFINITSTDSILFLFMTNTTVYMCSILLYPSSVNRHLGYFLEIIFKIYSTSWLGTTSILHKISRKFLKNHANFRVLICLYGNSKISYIIEFSRKYTILQNATHQRYNVWETWYYSDACSISLGRSNEVAMWKLLQIKKKSSVIKERLTIKVSTRHIWGWAVMNI